MLVYKNCRAPRFIYLCCAIGDTKEPTRTHMEPLQQFIEKNNYLCGGSVKVYSSVKAEAPTEYCECLRGTNIVHLLLSLFR